MELLELEGAVDYHHLQTAAIFSCMKDCVVGGSFSFEKRKFQKIALHRVSPDSCSSSPTFFIDILLFGIVV